MPLQTRPSGSHHRPDRRTAVGRGQEGPAFESSERGRFDSRPSSVCRRSRPAWTGRGVPVRRRQPARGSRLLDSSRDPVRRHPDRRRRAERLGPQRDEGARDAPAVERQGIPGASSAWNCSAPEVPEPAVALDLWIVHRTDLEVLVEKFDRLLRLSGKTAGDARRLADSLASGTQRSAATLDQMLDGMLAFYGSPTDRD